MLQVQCYPSLRQLLLLLLHYDFGGFYRFALHVVKNYYIQVKKILTADFTHGVMKNYYIQVKAILTADFTDGVLHVVKYYYMQVKAILTASS